VPLDRVLPDSGANRMHSRVMLRVGAAVWVSVTPLNSGTRDKPSRDYTNDLAAHKARMASIWVIVECIHGSGIGSGPRGEWFKESQL